MLDGGLKLLYRAFSQKRNSIENTCLLANYKNCLMCWPLRFAHTVQGQSCYRTLNLKSHLMRGLLYAEYLPVSLQGRILHGLFPFEHPVK